MDNREKLFKLMQENPELPLVFMCSMEEMCDDYSSMFYSNFGCDIVTIYYTEKQMFDDEIDIKEHYEYIYEDEYENLSEEEFDKKIKERIDETPHYKAIRVYCY